MACSSRASTADAANAALTERLSAGSRDVALAAGSVEGLN